MDLPLFCVLLSAIGVGVNAIGNSKVEHSRGYFTYPDVLNLVKLWVELFFPADQFI